MDQPGKLSKEERHKRYSNSVIMQHKLIQVFQKALKQTLEIKINKSSAKVLRI